MKTVLTLCSANYLAQAKSLGDSVVEHNPDYHFVLGLVDRRPKELDAGHWQPHELIPVEDLGISCFEEMERKYDVVELNTAVKPFYMEYLYRRSADVDVVMYLDPDIQVFGSFKKLEEKLSNYNVIVTPHSCTFDDSEVNTFYEMSMLRTGIYNLGFIATSRSATTFAFLEWWQKRLRDYCYYQTGNGMFVDQIWVTLAPLYFPGFYVEKDPGYNMCYWNHFERRLSSKNGRYVVNEDHDLVFFHFSSFDPRTPDVITRRGCTLIDSFDERPDLKAIYSEYSRRLMDRDFLSMMTFEPALGRKPTKPSASAVVRGALREILGTLPAQVQKPVRWFARALIVVARRFPMRNLQAKKLKVSTPSTNL
jgi:hypothetical protein